MKNKYPKLLIASLMTFALFASGANAAVNLSSDFSFLSGSPVTGTLLKEGVDFTVTTTAQTEMFGSTAFKNVGGQDATVTFTFSEAITDFSFTVNYVRNDESMTTFELGADLGSLSAVNPTIVAGSDLTLTGGTVSTDNTNDGGNGTLSWTGLTNTNIVRFTIDVGTGGALAVESFTATAVPEPSTFLYLAPILGFVALRRKRR